MGHMHGARPHLGHKHRKPLSRSKRSALISSCFPPPLPPPYAEAWSYAATFPPPSPPVAASGLRSLSSLPPPPPRLVHSYGLRSLAEGSLLDLIASVRHHARRLPRIRWFGRLVGLVDAGGWVGGWVERRAARAGLWRGGGQIDAHPLVWDAGRPCRRRWVRGWVRGMRGGGEGEDVWRGCVEGRGRERFMG